MTDAARDFAVWLVDKPAGPTSHDVVAGIRARLGRNARVGHAGTLDPFATGLLVVLIGKATRLVQFLTAMDKTYTARVRLGATSVTGDPEGPITPTGAAMPSAAALERVIADLPGPQRQRVPALAAVKVEGEALYRRTRRGEETPVLERDIVIERARLVDHDLPAGWFDIEVRCSKGTYIRQLATDLGTTLGCGGYCESLRRTAVGDLSVGDAVAPEQVRRDGGVDARLALAPMPERPLTPDEHVAVSHGRLIDGDGDEPTMLVSDGAVLAIAVPTGTGQLHPKVVLV